MTDFLDCKIGDIFDVARGGSPRPIDKYITTDPNGINWIMIGDAAEGSKYIYSTKKKIRPEGKRKSRLVHPGDFLLTNSMSFGRPFITKTEGCIHDGWLVLSPKDRDQTDPNYFYYLLASPRLKEVFREKAPGAVVKNLNSSLVRSVELRVPSNIDEQKRIAAILDKADAIRLKRQESLLAADNFLRAVFLKMFGDPVCNPYELLQGPLAQCATFVSGATPSKKNSSFWEGDFPWVSPKDMKRDLITDAEDHVSEAVFVQTNLKRVPVGTPLIVVRGMILAHTVPIAITGREVAINQDIKAVKFDDHIDPVFGFWCLKVLQEKILDEVDTAAHGTKRIDMTRLGALPIHLPGDNMQKKFVAIVEKFGKTYARLQASSAESEKLFASLSQRAFRGEL